MITHARTVCHLVLEFWIRDYWNRESIPSLMASTEDSVTKAFPAAVVMFDTKLAWGPGREIKPGCEVA